MRIAPLILFALILVSACGGGGDTSPGKKIVPMIPERMENILEQQSFTCLSKSGENCPVGIGRLFILNPGDPSTSAVCTGFLVSADRMVTNHHCVSDQRDCNNTFISVHTSNGPVKARCRTLIFSEADSDITSERAVDLTVMRIEGAVPPPYFTISVSKQSPDKSVTAWVIDHVSLTQAKVTELTCEYDERQSSLHLKNCPAISGNSGSPVVLKGTRNAFAILWGSNLPPSIDATFPMNLRLSLNAFSLATELYPFREIINGEDSSLR